MIDGKATARFGTGDILVTPLVKTNLSNGCIVLQNKGTHKIGEYTRDFKESENDTILSFDNIQSLDVMIERLEKLKCMMRGDRTDCYNEIHYDF